MDSSWSPRTLGGSATSSDDYDALRLLGIHLMDAIARLLRAGKEN